MQYMVYVKMVNSQGLALSINSKRELALAFSFVFANLFRYMPLYGLVRSLFSEVIVSKGSLGRSQTKRPTEAGRRDLLGGFGGMPPPPPRPRNFEL